MHLPENIIANQVLDWYYQNRKYPSSSWDLKIAICGQSAKLDIVTTKGSNDGFFVKLDTTSLTPGVYAYQFQVTNGSAIEIIETGNFTLKANLFNEDTFDARSHAEKMVEAIEALLENRATNEHKSIKTNNRELVKHSFDELRNLRDYYRAELARENVRKRKRFRQIGYRF